MDVPEIEAKLPRSFLQLYEVITQILKENDILQKKEETKVKNVDESPSTIKRFIALQNKLVSNNSKNQQ
jgi:rRNA pseudouridine-1189 N-methylase Emg1 (Nep1/Mra1 family)